jgi:hypothetical protein
MDGARVPPRMRLALVLAAALALPLVPLALADEGCGDVAGTTVCSGDYDRQQGDDCQVDGIHERGTGVIVEATGGVRAFAGGYDYCNTYGGYRYTEEGVHAGARAPMTVLDVSWNTWTFEEIGGGPYDASGCSTWTWIALPVVGGYYGNYGCLAGSPPDEPWGDVLP